MESCRSRNRPNRTNTEYVMACYRVDFSRHYRRFSHSPRDYQLRWHSTKGWAQIRAQRFRSQRCELSTGWVHNLSPGAFRKSGFVR